MTEELLISIAVIIVLGLSAQWLAWRLRLPSILLLLLFGFLAGPVFHIVNPDEVLGDLLFPFVSIAVALILFEGGLSLKFSEIKTTGHVVRNLVTVGAVVTWVIAAAGAYYIIGMSAQLALLFGAILVVTGPTVIIPLLRHVQAVGRVSALAKWEGIVNDPVGAILAVLVFEAIIAVGLQQAAITVFISLLQTIFIGLILGAVCAFALAYVLRRYWIPDYLQSGVTLTVVIAAFAFSNMIQKESGLLTVTLMGIILTNRPGLSIKPIVQFKENLGLLLLSMLFIILSARLHLEALTHLGPQSIIFLLMLIFIARPASVFISTLRSGLTWKEKMFLAWMAPRGIVAAAVTSVFALELAEEAGMVEAEFMIAEMFLIIVGTVTVYGLTAAPVGRWLGVAQPNPQGVLFVGAQPWARTIAQTLQDEGYKVLLVDTNHDNISQARLSGLQATFASILSEEIHDELDLGGVGRLVALTHNDEVNALATLHFAELFGSGEVYQLPPEEAEGHLREVVSLPLRGRLLFTEEATYQYLNRRFRNGAVVKVTPITEQFTFGDYLDVYGSNALPLFLIRASGQLSLFTTDNQTTPPQAGQTIIGLVDPLEETDAVVSRQEHAAG